MVPRHFFKVNLFWLCIILSSVFFSRVSKSAGPNTCPGDFLSGTFTLSKNDLVKKKVCTYTLLFVPYKGSDCSLMREERAIHVHVYLVENVPFP